MDQMLYPDIFLEGAVAVQMVGSDVEDGGYLRPEIGDRLQLKARDLGDHDRVRVRRHDGLRDGKAYIAYDLGLSSGELHDLSDKRGGRGLSIGPGYADEGTGAVVIGQLELSRDDRSVSSGLLDQIQLGRDSRAQDQPVPALGGRLFAEVKDCALFFELTDQSGIEPVPLLGVPYVDLRPARKEPCGGSARLSEP